MSNVVRAVGLRLGAPLWDSFRHLQDLYGTHFDTSKKSKHWPIQYYFASLWTVSKASLEERLLHHGRAGSSSCIRFSDASKAPSLRLVTPEWCCSDLLAVIVSSASGSIAAAAELPFSRVVAERSGLARAPACGPGVITGAENLLPTPSECGRSLSGGGSDAGRQGRQQDEDARERKACGWQHASYHGSAPIGVEKAGLHVNPNP